MFELCGLVYGEPHIDNVDAAVEQHRGLVAGGAGSVVIRAAAKNGVVRRGAPAMQQPAESHSRSPLFSSISQVIPRKLLRRS